MNIQVVGIYRRDGNKLTPASERPSCEVYAVVAVWDQADLWCRVWATDGTRFMSITPLETGQPSVSYIFWTAMMTVKSGAPFFILNDDADKVGRQDVGRYVVRCIDGC